MPRAEFYTGHDWTALVGMLLWLLENSLLGAFGSLEPASFHHADTCGVPEKAHVLAFEVWEQVGRNWRQTGFSEASIGTFPVCTLGSSLENNEGATHMDKLRCAKKKRVVGYVAADLRSEVI